MSRKYVIVTGGVVSSLGKGITAATLGALLQARQLKVNLIKIDPYLNVDPGTMSPIQHGEVFVTDDGCETDLDLGYYERFVRRAMTRQNNFTAGQIYDSILKKERQGEYLGQTVQVVPHVTDEIKAYIQKPIADDDDLVVIEIGGTVGDIESLPFVEAVRQLRWELPRADTCFVHVTLLPFVGAAGEYKTKPTQHSVRELRQIGIDPDILLCRGDALSDGNHEKIALLCNVHPHNVFLAPDVDTVYRLPQQYHADGVDARVCERLGLQPPPPDLSDWQQFLGWHDAPEQTVKIAIVGKYVALSDSYKSLTEALVCAGVHNRIRVELDYIDAETIDADSLPEQFAAYHGVLIPGGFGLRGIAGKMLAIRYARETRIPYLGICIGMQLAVIEYARNVLGLTDADSTEMNPKTSHPVIARLVEWQDRQGQAQTRCDADNLGGTMRLGGEQFTLRGRLQEIYGSDVCVERHRHRYEFNNHYREQLETAGVNFVAENAQQLVEAIELPDHPWFFGVQFHPEFTTGPLKQHPLFSHFVCAASQHAQTAVGAAAGSAAD